MCRRGLQSQCETTQVREYGSGASLFGYTKLYGQVPGGQAEFLRVPLADYNSIRVGDDLPDERYLFLSDILPTAWQGVEYAQVPDGGTLAVMGLGPVGQFAARIGVHHGYRVLAVDPVPERRAMAERHGVETFDLTDDRRRGAARSHRRTRGGCRRRRGRHGGTRQPRSCASHRTPSACCPTRIAQKVMEKAGIDRLAALYASIDVVRRGGTVSLSGVYAGEADILPMKTMFDKQLTLRMGQCNVKRWIDELLPLVEDPADPARRHGPRDAPRAARGRPRAVRDIPEEGGRLHQGRAAALIASVGPLSSPPARRVGPVPSRRRIRYMSVTECLSAR